MIAGITLFFSPIYTVLDFLPIFGTIGYWIAVLVAVLVSLPLSTTVIATAWIRYRPAKGV